MISKHTKDGFAQVQPLGHLVHEIAKLLKRRMEDELRQYNLTLPQGRVLGEIVNNSGTGLTQVALASCIDADPMTVSGILDRLQKRGLVTRKPDPNDSRAKLVVATEEGTELVETVRSVGFAIYEQAFSGLSPDERQQLVSALTRTRNNLTAMAAEEKEVAQ